MERERGRGGRGKGREGEGKGREKGRERGGSGEGEGRERGGRGGGRGEVWSHFVHIYMYTVFSNTDSSVSTRCHWRWQLLGAVKLVHMEDNEKEREIACIPPGNMHTVFPGWTSGYIPCLSQSLSA